MIFGLYAMKRRLWRSSTHSVYFLRHRLDSCLDVVRQLVRRHVGVANARHAATQASGVKRRQRCINTSDYAIVSDKDVGYCIKVVETGSTGRGGPSGFTLNLCSTIYTRVKHFTRLTGFAEVQLLYISNKPRFL